MSVVAHLSNRSITCSMRLDAIQEYKTPKAQITWLLKQLKDAENGSVEVFAWYKNTSQPEHKTLCEIRDEPSCLISEGKGKILFSRFEIRSIYDLAGKFMGPQTFIENIEKIVPDFYGEIGGKLKAWVRPAPTLQLKEDVEEENAE